MYFDNCIVKNEYQIFSITRKCNTYKKYNNVSNTINAELEKINKLSKAKMLRESKEKD